MHIWIAIAFLSLCVAGKIFLIFYFVFAINWLNFSNQFFSAFASRITTFFNLPEFILSQCCSAAPSTHDAIGFPSHSLHIYKIFDVFHFQLYMFYHKYEKGNYIMFTYLILIIIHFIKKYETKWTFQFYF